MHRCRFGNGPADDSVESATNITPNLCSFTVGKLDCLLKIEQPFIWCELENRNISYRGLKKQGYHPMNVLFDCLWHLATFRKVKKNISPAAVHKPNVYACIDPNDLRRVYTRSR